MNHQMCFPPNTTVNVIFWPGFQTAQRHPTIAESIFWLCIFPVLTLSAFCMWCLATVIATARYFSIPPFFTPPPGWIHMAVPIPLMQFTPIRSSNSFSKITHRTVFKLNNFYSNFQIAIIRNGRRSYEAQRRQVSSSMMRPTPRRTRGSPSCCAISASSPRWPRRSDRSGATPSYSASNFLLKISILCTLLSSRVRIWRFVNFLPLSGLVTHPNIFGHRIKLTILFLFRLRQMGCSWGGF